MKIVTESQLDISDIALQVKQGAVLIYPTETSYGMGCDATHQDAVNRIFAIKRRPITKALIVLVESLEDMASYIEITPLLQKISAIYWPGPLTIVVPTKERGNLASGVVDEHGMVAFRISSHPIALALVSEMGAPLVSTSANVFGEDTPYDPKFLIERYESTIPQPDMIIDIGELPYHKSSTIIQVVGNNIDIIREGEIVFDKSLVV